MVPVQGSYLFLSPYSINQLKHLQSTYYVIGPLLVIKLMKNLYHPKALHLVGKTSSAHDDHLSIHATRQERS